MNRPAELAISSSLSRRDKAVWSTAAALVVAAHATIALALAAVPGEPPEAAEQSLVVDLSPLPVSTVESVLSESESLKPVEDVDPDDARPVETAELAKPAEPLALQAVEPERTQPVQDRTGAVEPVEQEAPEPVEPIRPDIARPVETARAEPVEEQIARAETAAPDIVRETPPEDAFAEAVPEIEAAVALPQQLALLPAERPEAPRMTPVEEPEPPRQQARKPQVEKKPVAEKGPAAEKKPARDKRSQPEASSKPAPQRSEASQKATASRAPVVNPARWNSQVRNAVARRVGRVRGMRGTVRVSFIVTAAGAITSAGVVASSGNPRLDSAALSMVRSARVPRPPEGLSGSHNFAIPLTFK